MIKYRHNTSFLNFSTWSIWNFHDQPTASIKVNNIPLRPNFYSLHQKSLRLGRIIQIEIKEIEVRENYEIISES